MILLEEIVTKHLANLVVVHRRVPVLVVYDHSARQETKTRTAFFAGNSLIDNQPDPHAIALDHNFFSPSGRVEHSGQTLLRFLDGHGGYAK